MFGKADVVRIVDIQNAPGEAGSHSFVTMAAARRQVLHSVSTITHFSKHLRSSRDALSLLLFACVTARRNGLPKLALLASRIGTS
jgi:hypothetical protein